MRAKLVLQAVEFLIPAESSQAAPKRKKNKKKPTATGLRPQPPTGPTAPPLSAPPPAEGEGSFQTVVRKIKNKPIRPSDEEMAHALEACDNSTKPIYIRLGDQKWTLELLQGTNLPDPKIIVKEINPDGKVATGTFADAARTPVRLESRGLDSSTGNFRFSLRFGNASYSATSRLAIVKAVADKMSKSRAFAYSNGVRNAILGDPAFGRKPVGTEAPVTKPTTPAAKSRPGVPALPPRANAWGRHTTVVRLVEEEEETLHTADSPSARAPLRMVPTGTDTPEGLRLEVYQLGMMLEALMVEVAKLSTVVCNNAALSASSSSPPAGGGGQ
jgi:hypothetical protein